jgi:hypothetical protein
VFHPRRNDFHRHSFDRRLYISMSPEYYHNNKCLTTQDVVAFSSDIAAIQRIVTAATTINPSAKTMGPGVSPSSKSQAFFLSSMLSISCFANIHIYYNDGDSILQEPNRVGLADNAL